MHWRLSIHGLLSFSIGTVVRNYRRVVPVTSRCASKSVAVQVVSPMSMSGVVLDAQEATLLLSTMAVAVSNCGRSFLTHTLLSWLIRMEIVACRLLLQPHKFGPNGRITRTSNFTGIHYLMFSEVSLTSTFVNYASGPSDGLSTLSVALFVLPMVFGICTGSLCDFL